jgi:hypothetical protein
MPLSAARDASKQLLVRSLIAHLRYTNPALEATVTLPRHNVHAQAILAGNESLPAFLDFAFSNAQFWSPKQPLVRPIQIADAFPLRAEQIYSNERVVAVFARSTDFSVRNARLVDSLPVLDGQLNFSLNSAFEADLQREFRIVDEYDFVLDEFTVQDSNAPSFVVRDKPGVHLVWDRPPGDASQPFWLKIRYNPWASLPAFLKFAGDVPSDYWPWNRVLLDDAFAFIRIALFLAVGGYAARRGPLNGAIVIGLALALVPLILDNAPWFAALAGVIAAGVVAAVVAVTPAAHRRTGRTEIVLAGGTLALAMLASWAEANSRLAVLPSARYVALAAFSGTFLASALVYYLGTFTIPLRSIFSVPIVVISGLIAIPIWGRGFPLWQVFHDVSGWAAWEVIIVTLIGLCTVMAGSVAHFRDTALARFLFALTFVDINVSWFFLPVEVIFAAAGFSAVWLPLRQRRWIHRNMLAVVNDRQRFFALRTRDFDRSAAHDAINAMLAKFGKGEVSIEDYEQRRRLLERYENARAGSQDLANLPLAIGPTADDGINGARAVWIGLAFGAFDVALGVPAILRSIANGTTGPLAPLDILLPAVTNLAFFGTSAFVFGYFFRFWRGYTGFFKGLFIGFLLLPIYGCGWYASDITPIIMGLAAVETVALYATIGLVFDWMTLRSVLPRVTLMEFIRYTGGIKFTAFAATVSAAVAVAIIEVLRGEVSALAKIAIGTGSAASSTIGIQ